MFKNRSWQVEDIKYILNDRSSLMRWDFDSVLHFGCGSGFVTKYLVQYLPVEYALGVDFSESQIKFAQKYYSSERVDFKTVDGNNWMLDGRFDHVCAFYSIGPTDDERLVFDNFYQHLMNNGDMMSIILNNHGIAEISKRILSSGNWKNVFGNNIFVNFDKTTTDLKNTLQHVGFSDVVCENFDRYQLFPNETMLKKFLFTQLELSYYSKELQEEFMEEFLAPENSGDLIKRVGKNGNVLAVPYQSTFIYAKKCTRNHEQKIIYNNKR